MALPLLLPLPPRAHAFAYAPGKTSSDSADPPAPASPPFDAELWSRRQTMHLDPPDASATFVARLARENGWSLPFAQRVIAEYRRVLYLAARACGGGGGSGSGSSAGCGGSAGGGGGCGGSG